MSIIIPVFQYEIRYNPILNFSQIGRKIIAPYIKLTKSFNIENNDTLNERILLYFDEENYLLIIAWDRILIKGQGDINTFLEPNSPVEMPFFDILDKLKGRKEFGSIQNTLLAITFIKKLDVKSDDKLVELFNNKFLTSEASVLLANSNDLAIAIERNLDDEEIHYSYGPYSGLKDLSKRPLKPPYLNRLEDVDFRGLMLEHKKLKRSSSSDLEDFKKQIEDSKKVYNKLWKMF